MLKKSLIKSLTKAKPIQLYYSGIATIFMLHRVGSHDPDKLPANENLKVSPEFLASFIEMLLDKGYEIIDLDELYRILIEQKPVNNKVVFTFDDGYIDNLTLALPIFEKYNLPFTVYITTSFPDSKALLWWYALEDILLNHSRIKLSDGISHDCKSLIDKQKLFLTLRTQILNQDQKNLRIILDDMFQYYAIDWSFYLENLTLSWEHIITLAQHPLVTIGGHTINHYAFNRLTSSQIINEVTGAHKRLKLMIGTSISHFAYPFGSANEVTKVAYDVVKDLGLKTATTTRRGNVFLEHVNHLQSLPRVMLTNDFKFNNIFAPTKSRIVI